MSDANKNIFLEMKDNIYLEEYETFDEVLYKAHTFNEQWEEEHLGVIINVSKEFQAYKEDTKQDPLLEGCSSDDIKAIFSAVNRCVTNYKTRLYSSTLGFYFLSKKDLFATLNSLDYRTGSYSPSEKIKSTIGGSQGGLKAKANRKIPRETIKSKIQEVIKQKSLWGNFQNTAKSIADNIHSDIEHNKQQNGEWQGITSQTFEAAKFGFNTVYEAVQETDTR